MDLTLREGYWIKFCMKLIAVISHDNYYSPKYHMKILLGDFNAKEDREDIFKPTIGSESLHEISNYLWS
jgi:hypothetical protein